MRVLVTGGAGFIGSHLAEALAKEKEVIVFDNMSEGREKFLEGIKCRMINGDILDLEQLSSAMQGVEEVYHFAADPSVKDSYDDPIGNFQKDCVGTVNVLEVCRRNNIKKLVFASSSVVYGNADMPTPETAEIRPISNYAAAKAASENYVMSYSHLYGIHSLIVRYANIIGPRSTHGICFDFFNKLKKNPKELEILGDGTQEKSYLHVKDAVDATLFAWKHTAKPFDIFNIGSEETITVKDIADLVSDHIGLQNVEYKYTGGKIGWPGDVPKMLLSIEKLKKLGWKPGFTIRQSIIDTLGYLEQA